MTNKKNHEIMSSFSMARNIKCERCQNPLSILKAMTPTGQTIYILFCNQCGYPLIEKKEKK